MTKRAPHAVVVGAGLGGPAATIRLGALGTIRHSEQSEPPLQEAVPLLAEVAQTPRREPLRRTRLRPTQHLTPGKLQQETGP